MDRQEILRDLDITGIAGRLGIVVKNQEGNWLNCQCPFHEDKKPSFRLALAENDDGGARPHEKGFWKCFAGCGSGSLFDLVIRIGYAHDFTGAAGWLGVDVEKKPPGKRSPSHHHTQTEQRQPSVASCAASCVDPEVVEGYARQLDQHKAILDYLQQERGISRGVLDKFKVGVQSSKKGTAVAIPKVAPNGNIIGLKLLPFPRPERGSDQSRFWQAKGSKPGLFAPPTDKSRPVLVVEAECDAMLARSFGWQASATGGTSGFSKHVLGPWLKDGYQLVLCPDADKPGREHLEQLLADLSTLGNVCFVPDEAITERIDGKDLGDAYKCLGAGEFETWLHELMTKLVKVEILGNPSVSALLQVDQEGFPYKSLENLEIILRNDHDLAGDKLWMNELGMMEHIGEVPLQNFHYAKIRLATERNYRLRYDREDLRDMLHMICRERVVNPVRTYLTGLAWDGKSAIGEFIKNGMALSQDQDVALKEVYIRKWLIGAVARAMTPGSQMDNLLVLYSKKQGIGKSRFVRVMGSPWFYDEGINPSDRDFILTLHQHWIVEVSELDATTRRRDISELRAFLSRRVDKPTPKYQPKPEILPRGFVFVGTTNDQAIVREDDGRRYWPVEVLEIDVDLAQRMRDQIWAEALAAYRSGEKWWLDKEGDERRIKDTDLGFKDRSPAIEVVQSIIEHGLNDARNPMNKELWWAKAALEGAIGMTKMIEWANFLKIHISMFDVARALKDLGWKAKSVWIADIGSPRRLWCRD